MRSLYSLDMLENQVFGEGTEDEPETWPGEETEFQLSEELSKEFGETEPIFLTVAIDDGTEAECRVAGVFLEGEREYIALELPDGRIEIMRLEPGEDDGIQLVPVEDEEEQQRAIGQFMVLFDWEIPEGEMPEGEDWEGEDFDEPQGFATGQDLGDGQGLTEEQNGGEGPISPEERNDIQSAIFQEERNDIQSPISPEEQNDGESPISQEEQNAAKSPIFTEEQDAGDDPDVTGK